MKDGYIKVAAGSVPVRVADPTHNKQEILKCIQEADAAGVNLLVLPELCLTGYSCGDLFFSDTLLDAAQHAAEEIIHATMTAYPVVVFGLPVRHGGRLYNCAAVAAGGTLLGLVPKTHLPGFGEFGEPRHFASGRALDGVSATAEGVPFGQGLVFCHRSMSGYAFGVEICRDLYAPTQPAVELCRAGATIIVNPSASNEVVDKADWRRMHVCSCTSRLVCGYVM
ncbi:MAG: NAD(+) synthase, partial [Clostridia bacterium]|nr:NAD(+) synthase [Clostridia bacterium]